MEGSQLMLTSRQGQAGRGESMLTLGKEEFFTALEDFLWKPTEQFQRRVGKTDPDAWDQVPNIATFVIFLHYDAPCL